jgi:hypothetical protein
MPDIRKFPNVSYNICMSETDRLLLIDQLFQRPPEICLAKLRAWRELQQLSRFETAPVMTFAPQGNPEIDFNRFAEGTVLRMKIENKAGTDQRYYWYALGPKTTEERTIFMLLNPIAKYDYRDEALEVDSQAQLAVLTIKTNPCDVGQVDCLWKVVDDNLEWPVARVDVMQLVFPQ